MAEDPQPNTLEWRMRTLEDRVSTLSQRTHDLAGYSTENRLNISVLKTQIEKTADKDDVERLERDVDGIRSIVLKSTTGIISTLFVTAASIILAVVSSH